jgi:LmbE family N-acetylglucosaminyl deacetylase
VAALIDGGAEVRYLVCSDGAGNGTAGVRMAEQRSAAAVLGVSDVRFLGLPDGRLEPNLDLRRVIAAQIRRDRPDLVITHYPRRVLDLPIEASHPDHVAVGEATLAAVYPADAFPDPAGLESHAVREVWVPGYERPNHFVDATPYLDRKSDALREHRSQTGGEPPKWVFEWMRQAGRPAGYEYAEAYRRIEI